MRRASHRPFLAAFDDERVVPCVLQGPGQAQTGDATACDYPSPVWLFDVQLVVMMSSD
jgi:hypothetical protein